MGPESLRKLFDRIRALSKSTALPLVTDPEGVSASGVYGLAVDLEHGLSFEADYFRFRLLNADGLPDSYSLHAADVEEIFLVLPYQSVRAVSEVVKRSPNKLGATSEFQLIVDPSCLWGWPWNEYRTKR